MTAFQPTRRWEATAAARPSAPPARLLAWVSLAAPALSLSGHAAVLALAAILGGSSAHRAAGSSDGEAPLLAFEVVDVSEPIGEQQGSASAVDDVPLEREGLAQGQDAERPGQVDQPSSAPPARAPAPNAEPRPERPDRDRPLPAPDSSTPPTSANDLPTAAAAATTIARPAPSDAEPAGAAALSPPGRAGEGAAASTAPAAAEPAGHGDPASTGHGGGPRRDRRPDVVERFNHDLPSLAFGVPSWIGVSPGESGPVTIVLELDEQGQLGLRSHDALAADRCTSRAASPVDARCARTRAAYESARRTIDGLYGRFELPGPTRGAGRVRLALIATVSGVATEGARADAPVEQPVEVGSTTIKDQRGGAHFVRAEGQRVDFVLQVLAVDSVASSSATAGANGPLGDASQ